MTRIQQNGINLLILIVLFSCSKREITFSKIYKTKGGEEKVVDFLKYHSNDEIVLTEERAIEASFVGKYSESLQLMSQLSQKMKATNIQLDSSIIQSLKIRLSDIKTNPESIIKLKEYLSWYEGIKESDSIFESFKNENALEQIIDRSSNYHFILINEAHYSAQHRSFTNNLLKPLWDKGFRYLALEGLGYIDKDIELRGYPTYDSGYYIRESSFANLIRNAIKIGYKIIPYESTTDSSGSSRDYEQAQNLFNSTLKNDKEGKVLVHAGYSHIFEVGDKNYIPFGAQLKKIINADILTIDQQTMSEHGNAIDENSYYKFVTDKFKIDQPTIFINTFQDYLVDPINSRGVDIQIYHPRTNYILNRPNWLINENNNIYVLPEDLNKLKGFFIQAVKEEEIELAIPYDQFIIDSDKTGIILERGSYILRLYNLSGELYGLSKVKVNY